MKHNVSFSRILHDGNLKPQNYNMFLMTLCGSSTTLLPPFKSRQKSFPWLWTQILVLNAQSLSAKPRWATRKTWQTMWLGHMELLLPSPTKRSAFGSKDHSQWYKHNHRERWEEEHTCWWHIHDEHEMEQPCFHNENVRKKACVILSLHVNEKQPQLTKSHHFTNVSFSSLYFHRSHETSFWSP